MNKKIKIIELLNKIANKEEVPIFIEYKSTKYKYDKEAETYYEVNQDKGIYISFDTDELNEEVEILEDNKEEIEELYVDDNNFIHTELGSFKGRKMDIAFVNKFNEISKAVNELRKEKE